MGDPAKPVSRTAEYDCVTKMPYTEHWTVTRDVSVPAVPKENEEATRTRLETAARDLAKTIHGCYDVKFVRLQSTPEEQAKAIAKYREQNICNGVDYSLYIMRPSLWPPYWKLNCRESQNNK